MQNITQSWFVQGMIKATTDAWLKGWDERNGGNLTLRWMTPISRLITATFMHNRAIFRSASPCLYWQIHRLLSPAPANSSATSSLILRLT